MSDSKNGCLHSGCLCCYTACDFEKMVPGCVGTHDCLCIRHSFCCAVDVPPRGLGITTNKEDEICKLGLFCCDIGIITPSALWAGVHQHCCCYAVGSIPCSEDFVPQMVCGCCYIQCFPNFGVCSPPPEAKALQFLTEKPAATTDAPAATEPMERGGDKEDPAMEESLQE